MIEFHTETGSRYEIERHYGLARIRRHNPDWGKRADDEWVPLLNDPHLEVGFPAILRMASLSALGPDDHGAPQGNDSVATIRTTSRVTAIYERDPR